MPELQKMAALPSNNVIDLLLAKFLTLQSRPTSSKSFLENERVGRR